MEGGGVTQEDLFVPAALCPFCKLFLGSINSGQINLEEY